MGDPVKTPVHCQRLSQGFCGKAFDFLQVLSSESGYGVRLRHFGNIIVRIEKYIRAGVGIQRYGIRGIVHDTVNKGNIPFRMQGSKIFAGALQPVIRFRSLVFLTGPYHQADTFFSFCPILRGRSSSASCQQ